MTKDEIVRAQQDFESYVMAMVKAAEPAARQYLAMCEAFVEACAHVKIPPIVWPVKD